MRVIAASITERIRAAARLGRLMVGAMGARVSPLRLLRFLPVKAPERLVVAPAEILPGDPVRAAAIYAGHFVLAGQAVSVSSYSIFDLPPPSKGWSRALHGFSWLTHLRAANTALAQVHARVLIEDWISTPNRERVAASPTVTARRVMSWLMHAPFLLEGAEARFHRRFLKSLAKEVVRLQWDFGVAAPGIPRLKAAMALTMAGLCFAQGQRLLQVGMRRLSAELERQILPDGGHISRNPAVLLSLLLDLLPLRQMFVTREMQPPQALLNAIDRILPMLRFFQHGDGAFALFNGMGVTPVDVLAAVQAFDDARGQPVLNAPHAGYQRLMGGAVTVLMDTGASPPLAVSGTVHAGSLAFEMSSGPHRLIVNCGTPEAADGVWSLAARATAAHATLGVADASSCRFLRARLLQRFFGAPVISGPVRVPVSREAGADYTLVRASHDGYAARFQLIHERALRLDASGGRLEGRDTLRPVQRGLPLRPLPFMLRFHFHPDVKAMIAGDDRTVLMALPNREVWSFTCDGPLPRLEESVHLADPHGVRRTMQIVIEGQADRLPRVSWVFMRLTGREAEMAWNRYFAMDNATVLPVIEE